MFTWFVKRSAAYKALEGRCQSLEFKNAALCRVNEELSGCRLAEVEKARAGQAELRGDVEELGLALTLRDHEITVLRALVEEQNTALEAALPIVTAFFEDDRAGEQRREFGNRIKRMVACDTQSRQKRRGGRAAPKKGG